MNGTETVAAPLRVILNREGTATKLDALDDAGVLVLTGEPLNEPTVGCGPFVMNTTNEMMQAMCDFQGGKFVRSQPLKHCRQFPREISRANLLATARVLA